MEFKAAHEKMGVKHAKGVFKISFIDYCWILANNMYPYIILYLNSIALFLFAILITSKQKMV